MIQKRTSTSNEPHQLFLSATPNPRSLSLVLYEVLDYTIIDELPKNRKTIETKLLKNSERNNLYENICGDLSCDSLLLNGELYGSGNYSTNKF